MPRNGSGSYTLPSGINPVVTQTLITSNWANTTLNDVAVALTNSIAKDGQTLPTNDLPMGGFRHTGVGDPTQRNQYLSLGYMQDGKATRLTNVLGVNQITATLPGGMTALTVGQILQLIPSTDNTEDVTIDINGIGAERIITSLGNELSAGNLKAGQPYLMSWNGADFILLTEGGGAAAIAQAAMSGWDRPTPDGPYPVLSIVNPTTIFVPAGKGRIIHPSARDLSGVKEVSWTAQNVVVANVATTWSSVIGVDENGTIVQFSGQLNPAWSRNNILLGTVAHINGQVNQVVTRPAIYGDMTYASYDLTTLFHNSLIRGGQISPNGINAFHVNIEEGSLFSLGADSPDVNSPNIVDFPDQLDIQFFPVTGVSSVAAITQNVPVTNYDPGGAGVITPIPGGATTASIHRLYFLAGQFLFLYGQNTYGDLDTALSQLTVDSADTQYPAKLTNATFLGFIVAQKNCLNLNDPTTARLVSAGGLDFSIGSAGSISDAPVNGLTYGRKDQNWVEVVNMPRGPQATLRMIPYYTTTFLRFQHGLNDTPEGGANTGSDYELRAYNDAGTLSGIAWRVSRATRALTLFANSTVETAANPTVFVNATGNAANSRKAGVSIDASGHAVLKTVTDADVLKSQVRLLPNGTLSLEVVAGSPFFSVTPTRVVADFNNPTVNSRMAFQTSGVNQGTSVGVVPNGTSAVSILAAYNNADPTNCSGVQIRTAATAVTVESISLGSGTLRSMSFQFNGVERMLLGTTGNLNTAGTMSGIGLVTSYLGSDPANTSGIQLRAEGAFSALNSVAQGTGTLRDISFQFNGTERMLLSTTGNLTTSGFVNTKSQLTITPAVASQRWNIVAANNVNGDYLSFDHPDGGFFNNVIMYAGGRTDIAGAITTFGTLSIYTGTVGTQTAIRNFGWVNGVRRWAEALESNASRTMFSYDAGGALIAQAYNLTQTGVATAANFVATSDANLKDNVTDRKARDRLPDMLRFVDFLWNSKASKQGEWDVGVIAQEVRLVAPEYVHCDHRGILSVDKAALALECVIGLAARVRELEEKLNATS